MILAQKIGVVIGRDLDEGTVRIEFDEPPMVVDFPFTLFPERQFPKYGTVVEYVVQQRPDGYQHQEFVISEAKDENSLLPKLREMLSAIDDEEK
jgi:hypothetical protein